MSTTLPRSPNTHHLTRLYIISLSVVAGFAILGQVLIQTMLTQQTADIRVINAAHQRQMLCQKLLKSSLAIHLIQDPATKQERLADLQAAVTMWDATHQIIQQELDAALSKAELAEVQPILKQLEPASQEIVTAAKETLANPNALSESISPRRTLTQRDRGAMIRPSLIAAERAYLDGIDQVINWYTHKAKRQVTQLQQLELALLGLTLAVLVLEGMLIFKPAVRKLQQTLTALAKSLQETQAMAQKLALEQEKSERLLLNILPEPIADRLKREPQAIADGFADVTILFADIVGFTELSSRLTPTELVAHLNQIFSCFDHLAEKHGLEKIKTIGDAYMVVGGLPNPREDHAEAIAAMALDMQQALQVLNHQTGESFQIRIGINTGPVVAGVIGIKKFIYDLWGDTVNIASRMESHGVPGRIQVTEATYRCLQHTHQFEERGAIPVKGKGDMKTYWLLQPKQHPSLR